MLNVIRTKRASELGRLDYTRGMTLGSKPTGAILIFSSHVRHLPANCTPRPPDVKLALSQFHFCRSNFVDILAGSNLINTFKNALFKFKNYFGTQKSTLDPEFQNYVI